MKLRQLVLAAWLGPALCPPAAWACATCFGRSDSALAQGMNMGILFLLGVVLSVLAALTVFFIHLGRRSARLSDPEAAPTTKPIFRRPLE